MNQNPPWTSTEPPAGAPAYGTGAGGLPTGGPAPMAPPPPRSPSPWLITLVVLLAVAVVGGGALLLTDGDGDDGGGGPQAPGGGDDQPPVSGDSPEAAFDTFVAAAADGDCQAVADLVTDDFLDGRDAFLAMCEENPASLNRFGDLERSGRAEVDGDTAVVPIEASGGDDELGIEAIGLVREGGAWRIDSWDLEEPAEIPELPEDPAELPEDPPQIPDDFSD